ncbi:hypothetical protein [Achromobacter deleyi]|uniref:hypothetical protein n=1 Tax=Achromobacter deleyi TaxID=1353891 RepID=UPI001466F76D|nr:hypothetical protein [Achromobacter deleyi]CAB3840445.1 hypothetical protein LMG3481_01227 [Achromobacter deleyi]
MPAMASVRVPGVFVMVTAAFVVVAAAVAAAAVAVAGFMAKTARKRGQEVEVAHGMASLVIWDMTYDAS